jgi:putative spermidine/putrescine transport system substrate-binding protein
VSRDWCGYGDVVDGFKKTYGLKVTELSPDAASGQEIEAIKASRDNRGPQAPDTVDLGFSFGPTAKAEGLLQPYKVSNWDTIPDGQKDPEGYWYGDYYGVLAFEINADLVKKMPADWADLLGSEYRNAVAISGDPRGASQSIQAVFAAGLSATKGDVDKAAEAGLDFFAQLSKAGNFVPIRVSAATLAQGSTPIGVRWDYLALADRDTLKGNPPIEIVVPRTGVVGSFYIQAVSAYAPHPNAAKLWMEWLYADQAQLQWLKGYCHPIRFKDLVENGKVPADLLARLPPAEAYEKALFPTLAQQRAAKEIITKQWESAVGVTVK